MYFPLCVFIWSAAQLVGGTSLQPRHNRSEEVVANALLVRLADLKEFDAALTLARGLNCESACLVRAGIGLESVINILEKAQNWKDIIKVGNEQCSHNKACSDFIRQKLAVAFIHMGQIRDAESILLLQESLPVHGHSHSQDIIQSSASSTTADPEKTSEIDNDIENTNMHHDTSNVGSQTIEKAQLLSSTTANAQEVIESSGTDDTSTDTQPMAETFEAPQKTTATNENLQTVDADEKHGDTESGKIDAQNQRIAETYLKTAKAFLSRGKSDLALVELQKAESKAPKLAEVYLLRAQIHISSGNVQLAAGSLVALLQVDPLNVTAINSILQLATYFQKMGKTETITEIFKAISYDSIPEATREKFIQVEPKHVTSNREPTLSRHQRWATQEDEATAPGLSRPSRVGVETSLQRGANELTQDSFNEPKRRNKFSGTSRKSFDDIMSDNY